MDIHTCSVFMVGSIAVPGDTAKAAMGTATKHLGDRIAALPDGETGVVRQNWAPGVGSVVFGEHPDVVVAEDSPTFTAIPTPIGRLGASRLRVGVTDFSLVGRLPYAEAALEGYAQLVEMREREQVSPDVRFQVSVPTAFDMVCPWFGDLNEWPVVFGAYERAMRIEIRRMLEVIPAGELLLQWDFATEVNEIISLATGRRELLTKLGLTWLPERTAEEALAAHTAQDYLQPMSDGVPDAVAFGYHLCLGTAIQFPTTPADDLAWVVRIANALVERSPHRVDFLHLPTMVDSDRAFFAPLADLEIGDTRVFGIAHDDGVEGIERRARAAHEFLPDFGISNYCGYGRQAAEHIDTLLADLATGADRVVAVH